MILLGGSTLVVIGGQVPRLRYSRRSMKESTLDLLIYCRFKLAGDEREREEDKSGMITDTLRWRGTQLISRLFVDEMDRPLPTGPSARCKVGRCRWSSRAQLIFAVGAS